MMANKDTFTSSPQIPNILRKGTLIIQENKKEYHHRTENLRKFYKLSIREVCFVLFCF